MKCDLAYTRFIMVFKMIMIGTSGILSLTSLNHWNFFMIGILIFFLIVFHYAMSYDHFSKDIRSHRRLIHTVGHFILMNGLLYYMDGFHTLAYVPYYFSEIIIGTLYFGKIFGIVGFGLCALLSIQQIFNTVHGMNHYLICICLFAGGAIIGHFGHFEISRSRRVESQLREFRILYAISKIMDRFPSTEEILKRITKKVAEIMHAEMSLIMFYDTRKDLLVAKSGYGICEKILDSLILGPGEGIERGVMDEEKKIVYGDRREHFICDEELKEPWKARYGIAIPLTVHEKVIGTLSLYNDTPYDLTKDEVKLLSIIGSRIGMILENDRTFKKVKHNAITDGLTGLYNHYQFYTRLKLEIEKAKAENYQLFLLMIDIDRFKSFNDQFGHMIGDQVLSEVAKTIQSNIRETDIAARYGGEEFTIILPNCTYEMAAVVADRIRYNIKKVGEKIDTLKGKDIIVTASIGIACYPNCTNDLSNLIDIADVRMYKGKEMGGDKVIV